MKTKTYQLHFEYFTERTLHPLHSFDLFFESSEELRNFFRFMMDNGFTYNYSLDRYERFFDGIFQIAYIV